MNVTCARSGCDNTFDDQSDIQPIPKRYCSAVCKKRATQDRRDAIKRGEERIHRIAKGEMQFSFGKIVKRSQIVAENEGYVRDEVMEAFVVALEDEIERYWEEGGPRFRGSRSRKRSKVEPTDAE